MNIPEFFLKPGTSDPDPRKIALVGVPLLLVLILLAVALSGGSDETPETTTTQPSAAATSTTTTSAPVTTTTVASTTTWPLTGLPATEEELADAKVLIAKIDNTSNSRPQIGLASADLVIEVVVEGGVPRLVAFFQSDIPAEIGPIRSAREVDPKLVEPFGALMAHSGGRGHVLAALREVTTDVGDPSRGATAYYRHPDRPGTYDLILRTADVMDATPPTAPSDDWLAFGEAPDGEQALSVELSQSNVNTVNYRYSASDGGYLRFVGDTAHEAEDAGQLTAANVIVAFVPTIDTGRVDGAGSPVPDYEVTGFGTAVVFRDGVAIQGQWQRSSTSEFFTFLDAEGQPIPMAPGTTWIELTPLGRSLDWQ